MKKRRRVLALFISIFLRNRSLSDARWFYGQKRKTGKGNLYLTENRLSWNEMCCASDNHNYVCHTCAKEFFIFELQLSSYWQNIKFSRYCPKLHIFTKIVIFQVYLQLFRPTASSLKISSQGHVRNTLFHFCQLWAVKGTNGRQKTYEIFYVYCIFYSGFMCQTTVIFGITKNGSLVLNTLASWNCFTCRNLFQNGVHDMSECLTCETAFCKKAQNFV